MKKLITLELDHKTIDLLVSAGNKNESFDSIIKRFLKVWNEDEEYFALMKKYTK